MKKIFYFLMLCCLSIGAFAQAPRTGMSGSSSSSTPLLGGSVQQNSILTEKDSTLVSPSSGGTTTWTAPIGAYQITKITIAGDGGNGGKGSNKANGGNGGNGALITDNNQYTLSSSLRSLQYTYSSGETGNRTVSFNSTSYIAGNGKNGTKANGNNAGTNGDDGVGNCVPEVNNVTITAGGANNGGAGGTNNNDGNPGQSGDVKIYYNILQIPVVIVKEGSEDRNSTILYYDQIGHALTAVDSAGGVEGFYYDANFTYPVDGALLCLAGEDSTVRLYAKFPLTVKVDSANSVLKLDCKGATNGKITLVAAGSTGTYTYSKDGESFSESNILENLAAGTYTLYAATAIDTATVSVKVEEPAAVTVQLNDSIIPVSCKGGNDGAFEVAALGGTGNTYEYSLNKAAYASTITTSGLAAGTYKITAKDEKGCESDTLEVTVKEPADSVKLELGEVTKISFMGKHDGTFSVSASGSNGEPYTYSFNNGVFYSSSADTTGCGAGTYSCYAKDSKGCQSEPLEVTLTDVYPMAYVKKNTTDTIGTNTLKAAVDSLNKYEGGTVLAFSDEVLNETVNVTKDITILAFGSDVTFTRGDTMKYSPMIVNDGKLTINTLSAEDTLIFDGGGYPSSSYHASIAVNNGTLTLDGNVQFRNNNAGWKIAGGGGSAILNKDSLSIEGKVVFENNYSYQNAGAILNANTSKMNISGNVEFVNNESRTGGGALLLQNGSKAEIEETAEVKFDGNKSANGGAINVDFNATLTVDGSVNFKRNVAPRGATLVNGGTTNINGNIVVKGDTSYNSGVITSAGTLNISKGEITENVLYIDSADYNNGTIVVEHNSTVLVGGKIHHNIFINRTLDDLYPLPASVVITSSGSQTVTLGGDVEVDTITLVIAGDFNQKVILNSGLTVVNESNPIVLQLDSLDKQVLDRQWVADALDNATRIADNYMKFKPSSDTLAINNKGYVVRKPEIAIDTVYLLQKGTKYEDYGITTSTGEVPAEALYVIYKQEVDATGQSAKTTADSLVLNMSVDFNHGSPVMLDKKVLSNNQNTNTFVEIPFPSALTGGALSTGRYTINATAKVYTLGLEASDDFTQSDSVYIPNFTIDTLNFLLAGMKFSDYTYNGSCTLANTNDGAGEDIIPADEIFVGYQRSEGGNVDTAFIKVTLTDADGANYTYEEGTAVGQILEPGCGHFRQFTNSAKWNQPLNLSDAFDGKDFTYTINIHTKTQGEPYFAVGTKKGTYHHEIDRECTLALENADACNAMGIQFAVNATNDTISLTYPNFFDKNAVPAAMKQDGVIKVGISFDPQDEKLTMAWFDEATDITADGKYIVWIPISKAIPATSPIVVAENYAITPDTLRLSHTDVNGVYRKTFVVKGTLTEANITPANITYHTTGASGVTFRQADGPIYNIEYDANDYTVWNVQNPESFGKDNGKVYAGLYVNRPNNDVNYVYSTFVASDTVQKLQNDLLNQLTDSAYVQYVEIGTCANQETKDYTFRAKGNPSWNDFTQINGLDTVYWFSGNQFVKAESYIVRYYFAPKYTVNFNFHGGGATCNVPYSDTFADTTYVFGRPIVRPDDPFKCGHLFMDWRHGVDSFTVDSFKNIRAGIAEGTVATTKVDSFGIRSNMVLDAAWKYFVTIEGLRDTAVVANYSLCEINTRDYVVEPTEAKRPYIYTFHKDYLGKYYRDYIPGKNGNCDVRFGDSVYLESPKILPVGQPSQVTWTVTDMCNTTFTLTQNVNVMFPPCGADNYDPAESAYVPETNNHGSLGGEYIANIDSNDYRTVRIGCNCWLKENLQNDQYANGSNIAIAKAYLDDETKVPEFGRLYTWYSAVNVPEGDDNTQPATANETITFTQTSNTYSRDYVQGICPYGWHIPTIGEYMNVKDLVGTANALKAVNSNYWLGYQDATDAAEFTGVPGGYYDNSTDKYFNILGNAYFWSTENYGVKALPCTLLYGCPEILFTEQNKFYGSSVRCVRNIQISYEE